MNCPKCKSLLPEDSDFCQYCGVKLQISAEEKKSGIIAKQQEVDISKENANTLTSSFDFPTVVPNTNSVPQKTALKEKKNNTIILILISFLLFGSLIANVIQYNNNVTANKVIELFQKENKEKNIKITSLENTISVQKAQIADLQLESIDARKIYYDLNAFSYGTRYSDFFPNTEVLIVKIGETKPIRITYNVPKQSTVSFRGSNSNSIGEWEKNWDNNTCIVDITGNTVGTTTYSFTNQYNNHSFNVLVIVVP